MRLDKYLVEYGAVTRSDAKKLCKSGKVIVDGTFIKDSAVHVKDDAVVMINGEVIQRTDSNLCYMLNKPAGFVCANKDASDLTVMDLLKDVSPAVKSKLNIVGRLDKDSTGLILLTTDGQLLHKLISPRSDIPKCYEVHITGELSQEDISILEAGVDIGDEELTKPARIEIVSSEPSFVLDRSDLEKLPKDTSECIKASIVRITITEGRFHQVKRMFHVRRHEVFRLHRLSEGEIELDSLLEPGEFRELTREEMVRLI